MNRMFRRLSIILHLIIKLSAINGFFFSVCFGFCSSILRWTNEKKVKMKMDFGETSNKYLFCLLIESVMADERAVGRDFEAREAREERA